MSDGGCSLVQGVKVLEEAVGRRNVHREQETLGPVAAAQTCQPRGAECSMHQAGERQCTRREVGSTIESPSLHAQANPSLRFKDALN